MWIVGLTLAACTAALPGTPLQLRTAGFQWALGGCPAARLTPFAIERKGNELEFIQIGAGPVSIVWPNGFAARLVDGRAVLYASDGTVVGREGEVVEDVGGADSARAGGFVVCSIGFRNYR